MSDEEGHRDPFNEVAKFLVEIGRLTETDAQIYALGLKKCVITSRDVIQEIPKFRQTTAGDRLRALARSDFFEMTPSDSAKGGAAKKFKAIPPSQALKGILSAAAKLNESVVLIDEHFEHYSQDGAKSLEEDDIWLIQSEDASFSRGATLIRGATNSLKICSNDCSWIHQHEVNDAINYLLSKKVSVTVIANPTQREASELKNLGARVLVAKEIGIPFCILDDRVLLFVGQTGIAQKRYNLLTTKQSYLVEKQLALFNKLSSRSKAWKQ